MKKIKRTDHFILYFCKLYDLFYRSKIKIELLSFIEHKVGNTLWHEIAHKMYPDKTSSFREAISNSLDEGSSKIIVEIHPDKITIEDFGDGIDDMDKFIMVGHDGKLQRENKRSTIGQKGMGKLSLLILGDEVTFLSNNGRVGYKFRMIEGGQYRETPSSVDQYLPHKGTFIEIPNPKKRWDVEKVRVFLKKAFSLQVAMGKEIIINSKPLKAPKSIQTKETFILALKGNRKVTGNLQTVEKNYGSVNVYVQHVFITNLMIDPERKFTGWVNCDSLIPTASRSDLYEDDDGIKEEFIKQMMKHVQRFPKANEQKQSSHMLTEQENIMDNVLKELKLEFRGEVLAAIGNVKKMDAQSINVVDRTGDQKIQQAKNPQDNTNKSSKRERKTKSGVIWRNAQLGNEKPPYLFSWPNIIIRNTTNDIYKYSTKTSSSLGPAKVRYLQFYARLIATMHPDKKYWSTAEFLDKADKYYNVCLKSVGYIDN